MLKHIFPFQLKTLPKNKFKEANLINYRESLGAEEHVFEVIVAAFLRFGHDFVSRLVNSLIFCCGDQCSQVSLESLLLVPFTIQSHFILFPIMTSLLNLAAFTPAAFVAFFINGCLCSCCDRRSFLLGDLASTLLNQCQSTFKFKLSLGQCLVASFSLYKLDECKSLRPLVVVEDQID